MDGFRRNIEQKVDRLAQSFPAVIILGARQCGKSTLSQIMRPDWNYIDLENPNHYQLIADDPVLFFRENPQRLIIDEAQQLPMLFEVLRGVIDADRSLKNRFILTGSASFDLMKNISESLAGRVGIVELSAFKVNKMQQQPLPGLYQIFEQKISTDAVPFLKTLTPHTDITALKQALLKGGYPEPALSDDPVFHQDWMENYFDTYINRDMRTLFPRIDLIKYRRVLAMLSHLSGTIINKSEIARSIEASEKTVRDYIDIVTGTYFWRQLEAFTTSKVKTTLKLPKGHFRDSGLTLFLQNIHTTDELTHYPFLGRTFESFIVEELIKGIEAGNARNVRYCHFRTKAGAEIGFVVEGSFGLLPIEIKYQSSTPKKQLTALQKFVDLHKLPLGILVNNSTEVRMLSDNIIQIPAGCV